MVTGSLGEITPEEQEKVEKYLYRYPVGSEIIHEGSTETGVLYLLRQGSVGVYRQVEQGNHQISSIDAVNFFGEMAMLTGNPRTASIRVTSPFAIVYKFPSFDLKAVYTNPAWAQLLIRRLANDLVETNNHLIALEKAGEAQQKSMEAQAAYQATQVRQTALLLAALQELLGNIAADVVMNSRDWKLVVGMRDLIHQFTERDLPAVLAEMQRPENHKMALQRLKEGGSLPDNLKPLT
jgi:CRP-like cAMP-binding protein